MKVKCTEKNENKLILNIDPIIKFLKIHIPCHNGNFSAAKSKLRCILAIFILQFL
jgi:hypothetical protein